MNRTLKDAIERLKDLYETDQPDDFVAMELLVATEIRRSMHPDGLLKQIVDESESMIPEHGFSWISTPTRLKKLIVQTRKEFQRAEHDADGVFEALLTEVEPAFLSNLK